MMKRGASLSRRLLTGAAVFIAAALLLSSVALYFVLHRFVQGQIDQRLDSQVVFLASMLRSDANGTLSLAGSADGPPFDRQRRGWYWQITGPSNALRSRSLANAELNVPDFTVRPRREPPPPPRRDELRSPPGERPIPADGPGPDDEYLHFRIQNVTVSGTPATIVVSSPRQAVAGPLREAMLTLAVSLAIVAVALIAAMLLQVRLGLRPLERLRAAVADVRAGRSERVPDDQPAEVKPLVAELNALLAQNTENLERARRHVANLAHGLKTPLATLAVAPTGGTETRDLIALMERRIRHHLGRARSAALAGPVRARTGISPRLDDLGEVLRKVHADKNVALSFEVPSDLAVACEPQDFDEMAGNLMENAFKWARSQVAVSAVLEDRNIVLTFADDGPGLTPEQVPEALRPGARLDETTPGFGFGLSITRELAELYGGTLSLSASSRGGQSRGLATTLTLPAAAT